MRLRFKSQRPTQDVGLKRSLLATLVNICSATGQNQDMMELLQDLRDQVSDRGRTRIDHLLASVRKSIAVQTGSLKGTGC
jgi:hypothetical protein